MIVAIIIMIKIMSVMPVVKVKTLAASRARSLLEAEVRRRDKTPGEWMLMMVLLVWHWHSVPT